MSKIWEPYNLARELDIFFEKTEQGALETVDFYNLVECLQAIGSKNQKSAIDLFKKLSKIEVNRRTKLVMTLHKLSKIIKRNKL